MDGLDEAAQGAALEIVTSDQTEAEADTTDTEGQVETQPAEGQAKPEEKTAAQIRRERREQHQQRLREEKDQAEARARDLEARLERIKASQMATQEPKEADFSDIGEYWAAKGAWNYARMAAQAQVTEVQTEAQAAKQETQRIEAAAMAARQEAFFAAEQDARTRYADYDAVARNPTVPISETVASIILESEQPADLAYAIGKDPTLALALSRMPPLAAAREIGRLEARLSAPQPKLVSNAPTPINPVRPTGGGAKDPATMSNAEYRAWREAGGRF